MQTATRPPRDAATVADPDIRELIRILQHGIDEIHAGRKPSEVLEEQEGRILDLRERVLARRRARP